MFATLVNRLNQVELVARKVKHTYPEGVLFATVATAFVTQEPYSRWWSLERLLPHRGVVVFTRQRIFLVTKFWTLPTFLYLFIIAASLFLIVSTQSIWYSVIAFVAAIFMLQRCPYQQQIEMQDMQEIHLCPVRSMVGRRALLTIFLDHHAYNIVPAEKLPEQVIRTLATYVDREVVVQLTPVK